MSKLHIIASPRGERSKSKILWDYLFSKLDWEKEVLDLNTMEIPYITEEVIGYNYGFVKLEDLSPSGKNIVEIQSKFIEQIKKADEIVVSVPLWNFGMPAILKAYIDLIVKVWVTFNMWENGYIWLVNNVKNLYLVWAKWWVYKWQPWESIDMLESTVKQAFAFIGITNAKTFWLEWVNSWSDEELNNKINEIKSEIDKSL